MTENRRTKMSKCEIHFKQKLAEGKVCRMNDLMAADGRISVSRRITGISLFELTKRVAHAEFDGSIIVRPTAGHLSAGADGC